ncbi:TnsA endonuclease N-terminal domain-containing protein [Vibrio atlanticus]|uniref:TnsA endonuclease N-terminal domain-containing protein n=1 Tax=Vibrio atlanticus TaxID=693153 RepID=UPI00354C022A
MHDGQRVWYEAVCVKPREKLSDNRTAEKLDVERVWWELLGVPFHIFCLSELNQIKSRNIQWITDAKRRSTHQHRMNLEMWPNVC